MKGADVQFVLVALDDLRKPGLRLMADDVEQSEIVGRPVNRHEKAAAKAGIDSLAHDLRLAGADFAHAPLGMPLVGQDHAQGLHDDVVILEITWVRVMGQPFAGKAAHSDRRALEDRPCRRAIGRQPSARIGEHIETHFFRGAGEEGPEIFLSPQMIEAL
jgi:hypothetical protein